MSTSIVPRFLLPRPATRLFALSLHRHARLSHLRVPLRNASSTPSTSSESSPTSPNDPLVLEKPTRFNPPSHPSRLRAKPRIYPGPSLSEEAQRQQTTKKYPHMMPPEGSLMHQFLTNRALHAWITISVLTLLAFYTFLVNFLANTPFRADLPSGSQFWSHPFAFTRQCLEVYKLDVARRSAETAERRRRKVEDVKKRSEYRKAHGLEGAEGKAFGGWSAKEEGEGLGPAFNEGVGRAGEGAAGGREGRARSGEQVWSGEEDEKNTYVDFEGRRRPVKKWFGIW